MMDVCVCVLVLVCFMVALGVGSLEGNGVVGVTTPSIPLTPQQRKDSHDVIAQQAVEVLEERPSDDSEAV